MILSLTFRQLITMWTARSVILWFLSVIFVCWCSSSNRMAALFSPVPFSRNATQLTMPIIGVVRVNLMAALTSSLTVMVTARLKELVPGQGCWFCNSVINCPLVTFYFDQSENVRREIRSTDDQLKGMLFRVARRGEIKQRMQKRWKWPLKWRWVRW